MDRPVEQAGKPTGPVAMVIVAKAPQPGKVKTRLCPPLTFEQAAELYTGFLLDTVELAQSVSGCEVKIVCPTAQDAQALAGLIPVEVEYIVQPEPGLSAALATSFRECLAAGYRAVFCISSDNPTLPVAYLNQAVARVTETDVVLGPSEDGGYYLIGAGRLFPTLFENMEWSTNRVLGETARRIEEAGLGHYSLPLWYDLDTGTELIRFIRELPADQKLAVHTRRLLDKLPLSKLQV